jgi:dethiobiotin synthetase
MTRGWFVTGTDTNVGKTWVSQALLHALARTGRRAVGMKPVASGCYSTLQGLRSPDVEALCAAGNVAAGYGDVNPYALAPPTAPHLAAAEVGIEIDINVICNCYARLAAQADDVVVEGAGGWLVPIGPGLTMADVARDIGLPVILVVGLRLGAINHALLTRDAIAASGCRLAGWVANAPAAETPGGYLDALRERLEATFLGYIPYGVVPQDAAACLDLSRLA